MKIEKTYIGEQKVYKTYNSIDEIRQEYLHRGESPTWVDSFLHILEKNGQASDRFASYKVIEEHDIEGPDYARTEYG